MRLAPFGDKNVLIFNVKKIRPMLKFQAGFEIELLVELLMNIEDDGDLRRVRPFNPYRMQRAAQRSRSGNRPLVLWSDHNKHAIKLTIKLLKRHPDERYLHESNSWPTLTAVSAVQSPR